MSFFILQYMCFAFRCCLLEPGPVLTPIVPKAQDWCKERVDLSTADPQTLHLMDVVVANVQREFASAMQSCEEIAQVVKEIILGKKCDLRHQTNDKYGSVEVAAKLAEPTGNKSVDIITKRYFSRNGHDESNKH